MFMPGWTQILLVVLLIVLLFGRGKISDLMGDFAKGINSFKKGLKDGDEQVADIKEIDQKTGTTIDVEAATEKTDAS